MTEEQTPRSDADSAWKDIIEEFTEDFFEFYFPDVHNAIDFSKPIDFLDSEFSEVEAEAVLGERHTDRLIKVHLREGQEQWLLIHIEVQGKRDPGFSKRMFVYNYRIFDYHDHDVISLAVLADDTRSFRPNEYRREALGFRLSCIFPTAKLIDYTPEQLASSTSPFALVTQSQIDYLRTGADPEQRLEARLALTRRLFKAGYTNRDVARLYRFLGFVLRLPASYVLQYRKSVRQLEKELDMPHMTDIEELAREEGQLEGQLKGHREDVIEALEIRFGDVPYQTREAVNHVATEAALKKLLRSAITIESLDKFKV